MFLFFINNPYAKDPGIILLFFFCCCCCFLFVCFVLFCCVFNCIQLVVIGHNALFNTNISQVKTILISGSDCLDGTTISSNFGDSTRWSQSDRILTLTINCSVSYDFDVYCSQHDTCNIDCMTNHSCVGMNLHCNGTCNVSKSMFILILLLCLVFVM